MLGECEVDLPGHDEWKPHGSGRPGIVLTALQVPVEHPDHGVAGQIFEARIDNEVVASGRPRDGRNEGPGALLGPDRKRAWDRPAAWSPDDEAAKQQAVVERPVEVDDQAGRGLRVRVPLLSSGSD